MQNTPVKKLNAVKNVCTIAHINPEYSGLVAVASAKLGYPIKYDS